MVKIYTEREWTVIQKERDVTMVILQHNFILFPNGSNLFTHPSDMKFNNNYLFQLELGGHFILSKIEQWPPEHDCNELLPLIWKDNIWK